MWCREESWDLGLTKNLLIPWQHGREVAVEVPDCQSKLGEEQGRAGVVGGGSWCCPGAGADISLFAAGADTLSL